MNKLILCVTFLFLGMCTVHADTGDNDPNIDPSFYYVKLGGGSMPGGEPSISLSIGGRYRWGNHGLDLSLNGQTFYAIFVFDGLLTTKAQYLYYPRPNSRLAVYVGGGGGFGFGRHDAALPTTLGGGGSSHSTRFMTMDGVIGWEFRRDKRIKPLLQLEVSQPLVYFKGKDHSRWKPAVVISIGLGW